MRTPLLALLVAASAQAATVTYSNTATDYNNDNVYTHITLQKFDSTLGTLTGVSVIVNQLSLNGYFTVTSDADSNTILLAFTDTARLQSKGLTDLGFTAIQLSAVAGTSLTLTPGINTTVNAGASTQFNVTNKNLLAESVYTISSGAWSNYTGTGDVKFQLRNTSNITNSFEFQPVVSTSNLYAYADMSVTYTYDAVVPEPSTYGMMLGGLALAAVAIRRRRKASKA